MFLLFSKVVTLVYENCLGCFVALSLEFFDMITEDNDFIMKYDTYFFISNIFAYIKKIAYFCGVYTKLVEKIN